MTTSCDCSRTTPPDGSSTDDFFGRLLGVIRDIRRSCAALREVFLPEEIWEEFQARHQKIDESSPCCSMILLALERGCLCRLTSPVHRFLLNDRSEPAASKQYLQDLREKWMFDECPLNRHRRARIFEGKLAELQFAEWLFQKGHKIEKLEARGGKHDVETTFESRYNSFEVKYLGQQDWMFEMNLRALSGYSEGDTYSLHDAANYLLFRAYEAARQLKEAEGRKVAAIIIEELTWPIVGQPIREGWIQWQRPEFVEGGTQVWEKFIHAKSEKYKTDVRRDLKRRLGAIDSVCLFRKLGCHKLDPVDEFPTRRS